MKAKIASGESPCESLSVAAVANLAARRRLDRGSILGRLRSASIGTDEDWSPPASFPIQFNASMADSLRPDRGRARLNRSSFVQSSPGHSTVQNNLFLHRPGLTAGHCAPGGRIITKPKDDSPYVFPLLDHREIDDHAATRGRGYLLFVEEERSTLESMATPCSVKA